MIKFLSFALLSALATADLDLPIPMRHPDHDFEPIYVRKYMITKDEADTLSMCLGPTHDCDWGLMVLLREESCIPDDTVLADHQGDERAKDCPLLIEGYSIYDTDNTSVDARVHKYHITNQAGVELPVFIFHRDDYAHWEKQSGGPQALTYGKLMAWMDRPANQDRVYRGTASFYFEAASNNVNPDAVDWKKNNTRIYQGDGELIHEADLSVVVKGVLRGDHEFSFTIDEAGDHFVPIVWDVRLTGDDAFSSEDEGLEEGGLAGAIVGSVFFGVLAGAFLTFMMMKTKNSNTSAAQATPTTTDPHKDVEASETHNQEPTESHD